LLISWLIDQPVFGFNRGRVSGEGEEDRLVEGVLTCYNQG
jgi:hypothetical protein